MKKQLKEQWGEQLGEQLKKQWGRGSRFSMPMMMTFACLVGVTR